MENFKGWTTSKVDGKTFTAKSPMGATLTAKWDDTDKGWIISGKRWPNC